MSTFKYDTAAVAFGTGQINWLTNNIGALLLAANYVPSKALDQFVSQIPPSAIIARSAQMTSPAIVGGVCRGLIPQFSSLLSTTPVTAFALYQNSGADNTSQLIYYSDQGFGFPFLPQGLNYYVAYDQTNGGWFQL